jgi:Tfp pilus assembly protein PilO
MKWLPKIPKERRNPLVLVLVLVLAIVTLIYFGLIRAQHASLAKIAKDKITAAASLSQIERTVKNSGSIVTQMAAATNSLFSAESDMASGDLYSWTYGTMRAYKQKYRVDVPAVGQPAVGDVDLFPSFPYKQLRFVISGTGYYHDLGKFIADFENTFPHCRIINLSVESANDSEKLSFRMSIIALVKPNLS